MLLKKLTHKAHVTNKKEKKYEFLRQRRRKKRITKLTSLNKKEKALHTKMAKYNESQRVLGDTTAYDRIDPLKREQRLHSKHACSDDKKVI